MGHQRCYLGIIRSHGEAVVRSPKRWNREHDYTNNSLSSEKVGLADGDLLVTFEAFYHTSPQGTTVRSRKPVVKSGRTRIGTESDSVTYLDSAIAKREVTRAHALWSTPSLYCWRVCL